MSIKITYILEKREREREKRATMGPSERLRGSHTHGTLIGT